MERHSSRRLLGLTLLLCLVCGCVSPKVKVAPPELQKPAPPVFPPQKAMETGDYAGLLAENQKKIEECSGESSPCDEALFNLGFVYGYPKSPYYNQGKALKYLGDLMGKYPQSPWAPQARVWTELLKKASSSEVVRRRTKNELQNEIKAKDATINDLQEQIKRTRDIDLEIEKRERQLLK